MGNCTYGWENVQRRVETGMLFWNWWPQANTPNSPSPAGSAPVMLRILGAGCNCLVVTRRRSDVPQGHPHSGVSKSANPWKPCKNSVHLGNADILSYAGRKCNLLLVVLKRAYPVATATRSREERHSGVATRNRSFCLNSFLW